MQERKRFTSREAREVINDHNEIMASLSSAAAMPEFLRTTIKDCVGAAVRESVRELMREVPIEELNRGKLGIRVKSLRDSGYATVADAMDASTYELERVNGISAEGAVTVRGLLDGLVENAAKGAKLRLNLDKKTPAGGALVAAVEKYRKSTVLARFSDELLRESSGVISTSIRELYPAAGNVRWFFTFGAKKAAAESAYTFLLSLINGPYGERARAYLRAYTDIQRIGEKEGWDAFAKDPAGFYNVIEQLAPGVLGTDDAVYGLPEDVAEGVAAEPLYPMGLRCTLRRYQEWGVRYVLHEGKVLLGDEMGLGKTVQAIAVMVSLTNTGATHFMVVCPASVVTNWMREIEKMSALRAFRLHGRSRDEALSEWICSGGVAVTTYETVDSLILPEGWRFTLLTVDEAHYIKNPSAKRTVNVAALSERAERLLFMTGTALENRVEEMIALIRLLKPEIADEVRGIAFMSQAPAFRRAVAPVYYRRRREDVLTELPELIESREWCPMNSAEEAQYERTLYGNNYALVRRVSWNAPFLGDSTKAARLKSIVEEAESDGRKILVFSFFLDTITRVRGLLGAKCLEPITGAVPPERRQEIVDEFERAPAGTVLAAQIQSGGTGLNIQSASVVVICEPQFKPSAENQAISRAYRMGQTRSVLVYRLLSENTVDEKLTELLENKQAVFDAFADRSDAAEESFMIDERSFGAIVREEIERINLEKQKSEEKQ